MRLSPILLLLPLACAPPGVGLLCANDGDCPSDQRCVIETGACELQGPEPGDAGQPPVDDAGQPLDDGGPVLDDAGAPDAGVDAGGTPFTDVTFTASPNPFAPGQSVTFTWSAPGAQGCISEGIGAPPSGTVVDERPSPRVHQLRCSDGNTTITRAIDLQLDCGGNIPSVSIVGAIQNDADITDANFPTSGCFRVAGNFDIFDHSTITNMTAFYGLVEVGGSLRLDNVPALTSLQGLELLQTVGNNVALGTGVNLGIGPPLQDLSGLDALATADEFQVRGTQLTTTEHLRGLTSLDTVTLTGATLLQNLAGFRDITALSGGLRLSGLNALPNLAGLSQLESVGELLLDDLPLLQDLDELSQLSGAFDELTIDACAQITDLDALSGLTTTTGGIHIVNNPALTDVAGISGITGVPTCIDFRQNDVLDLISGFDGVTALTGGGPCGDDLAIRLNGPNIVVRAFSSLTTVPGVIRLEGVVDVDPFIAIDTAGAFHLERSEEGDDLFPNATSIVELIYEDNDALTSIVGPDVAAASLTVIGHSQLTTFTAPGLLVSDCIADVDNDLASVGTSLAVIAARTQRTVQATECPTSF